MKRDSILIVDDVEINRVMLRTILEDEYDIVEAENGFEALDLLFNLPQKPEAVLLDVMMPELDGFEVLKRLKAEPTVSMIPVLFLTAIDANENEAKSLNEGAADYIPKPFNPDVVKSRVHNHIQLKHYRENLEQMLEKKTEELVLMHERTLETLATIIEYRSLESGEHIRRTSTLTRVLVERLLLDERYRGLLNELKPMSVIKAVALHDIGKIGIPDNILLKPGKLTPEEFDVMKTHTVIGCDIIDNIAADVEDDAGYLARAREICRWHHERWDGRGYPDGLRDINIPLTARILTIIDVYDALVSERCYKPAYSHEEAMQIIQQGQGTQFDPEIVKVFFEVADKIEAIYFNETHEAQEEGAKA